jgi:ABC-type glycerol-3-phosphate transport system substrate-binding protein
VRLCRGVLLAACAFGLAACGAVQIEAPPGARIRVLDAEAPAAVRDERVVWYALWGGKPLSDTSTAATIARHGLREVRVSTELTPWDSIVNFFTSFVSIVRRTLIVEGNP